MKQTIIKYFGLSTFMTFCAIQIIWIGPAQANSSEFAIIGDAGKTTVSAKKVRESIDRQRISQLILPGDNLYSSTYQSVWQPWTSAGFEYSIVAIGNHNGGYKSEMTFFNMPSEYYTKVIEGARFIVLNSDNDKTGPQQAFFLEEFLGKQGSISVISPRIKSHKEKI